MDTISYEIRPGGYEVFRNAKNIKQLDENFSRLYTTPKEYDLMRWRKRVNGKLKPLGVKKYNVSDESPDGIINEVIKIHKKTDFYVLCSGGKDSMCLAHYLSTNYTDNFKSLVFIDTGVGIRKTKEWLIKYAEEKNWPLEILHPEERFNYTNFVLRYGFPSAGIHGGIMGFLKFFTMRKYMKTLNSASAYISGTRKFESKRRFITTAPIDVDGRMTFISPFYAKTDEEVYRYLLENGLKRTPVHDILGMSGECMCGSFAQFGEREIIQKLDPELDAYISDLEEKIRRGDCEEGAKKHPTWGKSKNTNKVKSIDPNTEALICGSECGGGTMRGLENI